MFEHVRGELEFHETDRGLEIRVSCTNPAYQKLLISKLNKRVQAALQRVEGRVVPFSEA
jgi:hypothetical protein